MATNAKQPDVDHKFRSTVNNVAQKLNGDDKERLVHLYDLPWDDSKKSSLSILANLQMRGHFSAENPKSLAEVLKAIGRDGIAKDVEKQIKKWRKRRHENSGVVSSGDADEAQTTNFKSSFDEVVEQTGNVVDKVTKLNEEISINGGKGCEKASDKLQQCKEEVNKLQLSLNNAASLAEEQSAEEESEEQRDYYHTYDCDFESSQYLKMSGTETQGGAGPKPKKSPINPSPALSNLSADSGYGDLKRSHSLSLPPVRCSATPAAEHGILDPLLSEHTYVNIPQSGAEMKRPTPLDERHIHPPSIPRRSENQSQPYPVPATEMSPLKPTSHSPASLLSEHTYVNIPQSGAEMKRPTPLEGSHPQTLVKPIPAPRRRRDGSYIAVETKETLIRLKPNPPPRRRKLALPPGIEVLGEMMSVVTDEKQTIIWDGYGLRLHKPQGSLCAVTHGDCFITMRVVLAGQFEFPEGSTLVSAIYWLSSNHKGDFNKSLSLEIQHCAAESATNDLEFVTADSTSSSLPYQFSVLPGGVFTRHSFYGSVGLNHFTFFGIIRRAREKLKAHFSERYLARMYYTEILPFSFKVEFYVHKNLECYFTAIEKKLKDFEEGNTTIVDFETDKIVLRIPEEGVLENGWKIIPLSAMMISKQDMRSYQGVIPCQMRVEWRGKEGETMETLSYKVTMDGATKEHSFLVLESPRRLVPVHSPTSGSRRISPYDMPTQTTTNSSLAHDDMTPRESDLMNDVGTQVCQKWKIIATMLELKPYEIEQIAIVNQGNLQSQMAAVFRLWYGKQVRPYTWETIVDCLDSRAVGEHRLAGEIKQKFILRMNDGAIV